MKQKRHRVAPDIEIAVIHVSHVRKSVKILKLRTIGIMRDRTIITIRHAEDLVERFAIREFFNCIIEFFSHDKIHGIGILQRSFRQHSHMGTDKCNLYLGILVFDFFR